MYTKIANKTENKTKRNGRKGQDEIKVDTFLDRRK